MDLTCNEWKEVTLGEISVDNKGSYGIAASAVEYSDELYTYLRITDITDDGKLIKSDLKSVADDKSEKYLLKPNDIVFARTGNSTGRSYFYDGTDGPLVYAGFLIKFSLNPDKVNPKFMRFYTLSDEYKGWVASFSTGSTRGNINAQTYANMKINLPPRKIQDFLVDILSNLEEKIEINLNVISNLEKISSTLFKHWFIDFEFPNEEGLPYKSSGGKMVDSELGEIPEGWNLYVLSEITQMYKKTFNPHKTDAKVVVHFSLPAYDSKCYPILDEVITIKSNKWIVEENCVLFSKMNPSTPRVWLPSLDEYRLNVCSSEFVVLKSANASKAAFIYNLCKSEPFTEYLKAGATGSTNSRQRITPDNAMLFKMAFDIELIDKYGHLVKDLMEKVKVLSKENHQLEKLRDTLLPKLLLGEIEIPNESVVV